MKRNLNLNLAIWFTIAAILFGHIPTMIAAVSPITVTLQPGAMSSIPMNGTGVANYIVASNPAAPAHLNLSVTGGVPSVIHQITTAPSLCGGVAKICLAHFQLNPGEQCCLQFSYSGEEMPVGNHILRPIVSNGVYKFQPSQAFNISVTESIDYWVSPTAPLGGTGTEIKPFQNLQQAQQAVRNHPLKGKLTINVNLMGGTYRGEHNHLALEPQDSGSNTARVIYRAAPNQIPIISGAQKITGWSLSDNAHNIWRANTGISTHSLPRQLYVNGLRGRRARSIAYPNYYSHTSTGYYYHDDRLGHDPAVIPNWNNPTSVEFVTKTQWKMMRCPIAQIDTVVSNEEYNLIANMPCWSNANVYPEPWNFQLLSWIENAYEFLVSNGEPGDWYLDPNTTTLYYIPREGEDIETADVELPIVESLLHAKGTMTSPVANITFNNIHFMYATWFGPNSMNGYVSDQSAWLLVGHNHAPNIIGHDPDVVRTPGNLSFQYARNIIFQHNTITHMGGVGLDFGTGSQNNQIIDNEITDIASSGIQLGGVRPEDHHPLVPAQETKNNLISNNLVTYTGQDYYDAASIFIGVTSKTIVEHNDIRHTSWSGISIGWGWGAFDPGDGFVGLPNAIPYQWPLPWGSYNTSSAALGNQIRYNKIDMYMEQLWDGGAIYATGFQGTSMMNGLLMTGNVATNKRASAGGNIFYTDGGSRYATLANNVSLNNPQGTLDFGPCHKSSSFFELCAFTGVLPYGADMGGCIPYGDLLFDNNYLRDTTQFYDICSHPYFPKVPVDLRLINNVGVTTRNQVPTDILNMAGRQ